MQQEEMEVNKCEFCSQDNDEQLVGCCRDGECSHKIETLCSDCGVWDEEKEQWLCPHCQDAVAKENEDDLCCGVCSGQMKDDTVCECGLLTCADCLTDDGDSIICTKCFQERHKND
jgi:hypothetical protein